MTPVKTRLKRTQKGLNRILFKHLSQKDICNAMSDFFCSIGKDFAEEIEPAPNPLLAGKCKISKNKTIFRFRNIEVQEIGDVLKMKLRFLAPSAGIAEMEQA